MKDSRMKELSSPQNDQFKYWKSLTKSKGLKEGKHFLLSGGKLVHEVLADKEWLPRIDGVLVKKGLDLSGLKAVSEQKVTILAQPLYAELDVLGTDAPILLLQQPEIPPWTTETASNGLELLCPFGDPQNLGALIRTAYAFGAARVILLKEAAHPLLPKTIKASSGAVLKIPLVYGPSIQTIQAPAVALDLNGTPLTSKSWPKDLRLLLGEEGQGIPAQFQGEKITLPMKNPMESLNASIAASIVIFHLLNP
jgi:TrmH family RNA methyltransferase